MGAAVVAGLAIGAPWLAWLSGGSTGFVAIALVAAFHGWGRLVARLAHRNVDPVLAIWWGIAAMVALSGAAIALHVYSPNALVVAGVVAHTIWLLLAVRPPAIANRYLIVPGAIIALLAVLHVLGAVGGVAGHAFDDDGNFAAQCRRLVDTGALGDAIGYARSAQLGGHAAIAALATGFGGAELAHVVDALAFPLVLALVVTRIAPRDAGSALWTTLVVVLGSIIATAYPDLATEWLAIGLVLAFALTAYGDREDDAWPTDAQLAARAVLPCALCAGALIALRAELVPIAMIGLWYAWWRRRRSLAFDVSRIAVLVLGAALCVIGFALARHAAFANVRAAASLLGAGRSGYVAHLVWPLAIAALLAIAIALGRRRDLGTPTLVLSALGAMLIFDAREAPGRTSWAWHYIELASDIGYGQHRAPEGGDYERLLRRVPDGATVAVWVGRPELLDYRRHRIVDLRTPHTAALHGSLDKLITATGAGWLLVERDDTDVATDRTAIAIRDGVSLIELR